MHEKFEPRISAQQDQGKQREDHLQALELILGSTENAIVSVDLDGLIGSWNPGAANVYGYSEKEIVGKNYAELLPPGGSGEIRKVLDKIARGRQLRPTEVQHRHKDGRPLEVNFSIYPLRQEDGDIVGAYAVTADITRKKQAERALLQSTAQTQAVVDTVLDGIIGINEQGIIDSFNPAAERIFGYRAHEVIGRNVNVLMPEPYHSQHDGYLENYRTSGVAKVIGIGREVKAQRKDGSVFPIELAVAEMRYDGQRGFVGVIRDITERKEAERALHDMNEALESKVNELATALAQLEETQDLLVESEKMASLGGLVAGVAHEINTPLGVCMTAASVLHGDIKELSDSYQRGEATRSQMDNFVWRADRSADIIMKNLERAAELVKSFKQVAVDRSSSQLRQFALKPFLQDLLNSLHPETRKYPHEIEIRCDDKIFLTSYPGALAQVLTNLLQNSLRHAYDEDVAGHLVFEAWVEREMLHLDYSDDGRGISAENLRKIFEPFFTTARNRGGTGIGLNVTYNLVSQALGGRIDVESEEGNGVCFHIVIPLEVKPAPGEMVV